MNNRKMVVILMVIVAVLIVALVGAIIYIVFQQQKTANNITTVNTSNQLNNNVNNTNEDINNTNNTTDEPNIDDEQTKELAIRTFNSQFTPYEGEKVSSSQVKALISLIGTNNSTRTDGHTVNISSNGITKVDDVLSTKVYKVEVLFDVEGYINEVEITENGDSQNATEQPSTNQPGDISTLVFNSKFNYYIGDIAGSKINDLLKIAQDSVSNYPEHPLTISSNNLSDLNEIVPTETYRVTPYYDSAGYINKLNIDKIM